LIVVVDLEALDFVLSQSSERTAESDRIIAAPGERRTCLSGRCF
jgi:hypothetical protein